MSLREWLGLDWFDLAVHVALTAVAGVIVTSLWHGSDGDLAVTTVLGASVVVLAVRRQRGLRALGEGPFGSERLADVENRLDVLEQRLEGVAELEERLDFAERLLASQRDQVRLEKGER
jgi:hypothetical protein